MLFNSFPFLLFFLVVTPLYYITGARWRWLLLLLASCYFYAAFIPVYLFLLFGIILIDYIAGRMIETAAGVRRKAFLLLSFAANLGALGVFKYYNFFVDNFAHSLPYWHLLLPLGLSFHTFQAMSYTIEIYRGKQKAETHLGIYALYVMFYPQLVAGPIERPQQLLPQLRGGHAPDYPGIAEGLKKMLWGFFLKVVVADRLAIYVNYVYHDPVAHSKLALLLAILFFTFQIYCDFAGYSLIAIGAAKTMGITLAENFNSPYFSPSLTQFWHRWHITLSTWFRDYVYFPLGGSRVSRERWIFNILVVFLLSGLWHGAAWTFVIWGLVHGKALILSRMINRPLPSFLGWFTTFIFLCFSWVFFRSASVGEAIGIFNRLIDPHTPWMIPEEFRERVLLLCCFLGIGAVVIGDGRTKFSTRPLGLAACTALILLILLFGVFNASQFIYFQF